MTDTFSVGDAVQALSTILVAVIAVFSVVFQTSGVPKRLTIKLLLSDEHVIQMMGFSIAPLIILVYVGGAANNVVVGTLFSVGLISSLALGYFLYADYIGLQRIIRHIGEECRLRVEKGGVDAPAELDEFAANCFSSNQDTELSDCFVQIAVQVGGLLFHESTATRAAEFLGRLFQQYPRRAFEEDRPHAAKLIVDRLLGCGLQAALSNNNVVSEAGWGVLDQLNTVASMAVRSPARYHRFFLDDIYAGAVTEVLKRTPPRQLRRDEFWRTTTVIAVMDIEAASAGLAANLSTAMGAWAYTDPESVDVKQYVSSALDMLTARMKVHAENNNHFTRLAMLLIVQYRALWDKYDPASHAGDWLRFKELLSALLDKHLIEEYEWLNYVCDAMSRLARWPHPQARGLAAMYMQSTVDGATAILQEDHFRFLLLKIGKSLSDLLIADPRNVDAHRIGIEGLVKMSKRYSPGEGLTRGNSAARALKAQLAIHAAMSKQDAEALLGTVTADVRAHIRSNGDSKEKQAIALYAGSIAPQVSERALFDAIDWLQGKLN